MFMPKWVLQIWTKLATSCDDSVKVMIVCVQIFERWKRRFGKGGYGVSRGFDENVFDLICDHVHHRIKHHHHHHLDHYHRHHHNLGHHHYLHHHLDHHASSHNVINTLLCLNKGLFRHRNLSQMKHLKGSILCKKIILVQTSYFGYEWGFNTSIGHFAHQKCETKLIFWQRIPSTVWEPYLFQVFKEMPRHLHH